MYGKNFTTENPEKSSLLLIGPYAFRMKYLLIQTHTLVPLHKHSLNRQVLMLNSTSIVQEIIRSIMSFKCLLKEILFEYPGYSSGLSVVSYFSFFS
jgi:hypothetical protein